MDSLDDQECSHVIQTKQEYETLLNQRNRAKREKEETERAAAREISRVKQEAAHEADRAAQMAQNGLLADVGITLICRGSSYENLIETEKWKEIKSTHNTLFSRQFRANYRAGYWEYIIQHTKPLGIIPTEMRAGTKNG